MGHASHTQGHDGGGPSGSCWNQLILVDVEVLPGGVGAPEVWFGSPADLAWSPWPRMPR